MDKPVRQCGNKYKFIALYPLFQHFSHWLVRLWTCANVYILPKIATTMCVGHWAVQWRQYNSTQCCIRKKKIEMATLSLALLHQITCIGKLHRIAKNTMFLIIISNVMCNMTNQMKKTPGSSSWCKQHHTGIFDTYPAYIMCACEKHVQFRLKAHSFSIYSER